MMMPWYAANPVGAFGDKFRKAREKKNISLDDVSNVTKISARMLQAIEEEHFDQLPGGVFNKGFIRAYAKHLGLNDEEAVTDYLACLRQAQIDAHEVWDPTPPAVPRPAAVPQAPRSAAYQKPALKANAPIQVEEELPELQLPRAEDVRPPRREYGQARSSQIPWSMVAVVAVVIALVVLLWARRGHTHTEAASSTPTRPAAMAPTPAVTTPDANAASPTKTAPASAASTKLATNPEPKSPQPSSPAPAKAGTASVNGPTQTQATATSATKATSGDDNDVTVRTFPPTKPPAKPAPTMTLVIRAAETSWVSVTADGQGVTHETLIAPAATTVRASREVVARIGNAAGVTFFWNGQEIPAQGTEGEVKTFVFDAQGMHEAPNQPPVQNR